jgi:hypothetical protein
LAYTDPSEKLVNHDAYGDIDMTDKFLPEGVPIDNAHLQQSMSEIFKDCEWAIVIFDNILICASGNDVLYERIDIALDICIKFNVTLKMGKTWLGFPEVKFISY